MINNMKFEYKLKMCYNYNDTVGKTTSRNISGGECAMEEYKISYRGVFVGTLKRKAEESKIMHQFIPAQNLPQDVKEKIKVFPELFEAAGWREPIPMLENRIRDAKRFDDAENIVNQTDGFELERE